MEACGELFDKVLGVKLADRFPRMTYAEAMRPLRLRQAGPAHPARAGGRPPTSSRTASSGVRGAAADKDGRVAALRVAGGGEKLLSRKQIDDYQAYVARYGAKGLAYVKVNDAAKGRDGLQSPILKFLRRGDRGPAPTQPARRPATFRVLRRRTRPRSSTTTRRAALKVRHDLRGGGGWQRCGRDFPMFEWDPDGKRWAAMHHPFTRDRRRPGGAEADPGSALARAYDMVAERLEIGGGSCVLIATTCSPRCSTCSGIGAEEAQKKFGFLLEAPVRRAYRRRHRLRLDRLVMLMAGCESIRDVIAFPKTQTASCPLTDAHRGCPSSSCASCTSRVRTPVKE